MLGHWKAVGLAGPEETIQVHVTDMKKARKNFSQSTGFEPVRGDPNGFLVHRLNHSATTALQKWRLAKHVTDFE